jgi:hypothetical protein
MLTYINEKLVGRIFASYSVLKSRTRGSGSGSAVGRFPGRLSLITKAYFTKRHYEYIFIQKLTHINL